MLFAVRSIALSVPVNKAYDFIAEPANLPVWTNAFAGVSPNGAATLATPQGKVDIQLDTLVSLDSGVIDWKMTFPDGSVGMAHSRLIALGEKACAYSFVLTPPPVALEELEGALAQQTSILEEELQTLKKRLEEQ